MSTFRAVEAAVVNLDGTSYTLDPSRSVSDEDPVWAAVIAAFPERSGRFVPVEQATAAPGERRNVRRAR